MGSEAIDYRSDTLTRPTSAMRSAMAAAEVGDDVFGEDPTVNRLQQQVAEQFGKEAALFVPSGTMSNQIAVLVHCRSGDEFLCEAGCHIYNYEQGAFAQIGGVVSRTFAGKNGILELSQLEGAIRPDNAHLVRTRLVCLENTHNMAGGRIQPYENVEAISRWARQHGLATHLDGARLLNAVVATGIPAAEWAQHFDTVSLCFSKGLGAPVGSILTGPSELITAAHRRRKFLGGGMRQAGVLAAAALHALEHHVDRLADDHQHARSLAEGIAALGGLQLEPEAVDTNIVVFQVEDRLATAQRFVDALATHGVRMLAVAPQHVRAVTHLDCPQDRVGDTLAALQEVLSTLDSA